MMLACSASAGVRPRDHDVYRGVLSRGDRRNGCHLGHGVYQVGIEAAKRVVAAAGETAGDG